MSFWAIRMRRVMKEEVRRQGWQERRVGKCERVDLACFRMLGTVVMVR